MAKDIRVELEQIAGSLVLPSLDLMGCTYPKVISKGISDMSGGKLRVLILSDKENVEQNRQQNCYALFHGDDRVGQFRMHKPMKMVSAEHLVQAVEVVLRSYPTDRCVEIDSLHVTDGMEATKYDDIHVGLPLPEEFRAHRL